MISFLVIGSFWLSRRRKFQLIRRYDARLLTLDLLMLIVVAFAPFPSSALSDYGNCTATILYALTMLAAEIMLLVLWQHAAGGNRRIDPQLLDAAQRKRESAAPISTIVIFLLSIGIAFINENLARLSWLLILPITRYVNRR